MLSPHSHPIASASSSHELLRRQGTSPFRVARLALLGCASAILPSFGCSETAACANEPDDTRITLSDLKADSLLIDRDRIVLRSAPRAGECPVLSSPIQASAGVSIERGGSYCGTHDVGVAMGCLDIAAVLPAEDTNGWVTVEVEDGQHRMVVQATSPSRYPRLVGASGRYARDTSITVGRTPHATEITGARATLSGEPGRSLNVRVTDSALIVDLPADVTPGAYTLTLDAVSAPRVLRCEGAIGCAYRNSAPTPISTTVPIGVF